jgi:hypothetical protein
MNLFKILIKLMISEPKANPDFVEPIGHLEEPGFNQVLSR